MISTFATVRAKTWRAYLFPKNDAYIPPLKDVVRKAEHLQQGDTIAIRLELG